MPNQSIRRKFRQVVQVVRTLRPGPAAGNIAAMLKHEPETEAAFGESSGSNSSHPSTLKNIPLARHRTAANEKIMSKKA